MRKRLLTFVFLLHWAVGFAQQTPTLIGASSLYGGAVFSTNLDGSNFAFRKVFSPNAGRPVGGLVSDGEYFYAVAAPGGAQNVGIIFKVKHDGSGYQKLHDFDAVNGHLPQSRLILHDGYLFGTTPHGGSLNSGVLFKIRTDGTDYSTYEILDRGSPSGRLLLASDGRFYGTTLLGGNSSWGSVFSIKPDFTDYQLLYSFDNVAERLPRGGVIEGIDGKLYGMVETGGLHGGGVIFGLNKSGANFEVLHHFNGIEGKTPYGEVVQASDGRLYGMASQGGTHDSGTIFGIDPDGTDFVKLYDFSTKGFQPTGSLIIDNEKLVGVAQGGGPSFVSDGVIFQINFDGTGFEELFTDNTINRFFYSGTLLKLNDGNYYGVTSHHGWDEYGTVYKLNPTTKQLTNLLSFDLPEGNAIEGGLVKAANGMVYGVTGTGGQNARGVIFSIHPETFEYTILHHFTGGYDGGYPFSALTDTQNGYLVGLSTIGGNHDAGTVYRIRYDGTDFEKLYDLSYNGLYFPYSEFVMGPGGKLYGTMLGGGAHEKGGIVKMNLDGTMFEVMHEFSGPDGSRPMGALIVGSDEAMYGVTTAGGTQDRGTIFRIEADGTFEKLLDIPQLQTTENFNYFFAGRDGMLYLPMNSISGAVIYRVDPTDPTHAVSVAAQLPVYSLQGPFTQDENGDYYGVAPYYGTFNIGAIVKMDEDFTNFTVLNVLHPGCGYTRGRLIFGSFNFQTQSISFAALPQKKLGDPDFQLTAAASSGLPVSYSSSNPSVAEVVGRTVKIHGIGQTTITAYQAGNGVFAAALSLSQTLIVDKADFEIVFTIDPAVRKLGSSHFTLSAQVPSGVPVSYESSDPNTVFISGDIAILHRAGTVNITASSPGNAQYNAPTPVTVQLTIEKADQTIFFELNGPYTYSYPTDPIFASASSSLEVTLHVTDPAIAQIDGNTLTLLGAGTTSIVAQQPGNENYNPATPVTLELVVLKGPQEILFASPSLILEPGQSIPLQASVISGLPLEFVSSDPTVFKIEGSTGTALSGGTAEIIVNQAGNSNWEPAPTATQIVHVGKQQQTIDFDLADDAELTLATIALDAEASSGLAIEYVSDNPSVASVSGSTLILKSVGQATITATQAGNAGYLPASATQTILLKKKAQVITFSDVGSKTFGDPAFDLEAVSSSNLPITFVSSNINVLQISGKRATIVGAGNANITALQAGNELYEEATPVVRILVISKTSLQLTFVLPQTVPFGTAPIALKAELNIPGRAVTFLSGDPRIATIANDILTIHDVGDVTISASVSGGSNYSDVFIRRDLKVVKGNQTVNIGPIPDKTLGDASFALTQTSSVGLPIRYVAVTDKITLNNFMIGLVKAGRVTISAQQDGTTRYNSAAAEASFCIKPERPNILVTTSVVRVLGSTNREGNQWFRDGIEVPGATGKDYSASEDGSYTVQTAVDGCKSMMSEPVVVRISGVNETTDMLVSIYPNPAQDEIFVKLSLPGTIHMVDMLGRTIESRQAGRGREERFDIVNLKKGVFFFRVESEGQVLIQKFIRH